MYTIPEVNSMLFFDTETVPMYSTFKELQEKSPELAESWEEKIAKYHDGYSELSQQEMWMKYAGLHIEFSKIVCISFGKIIFPNLPKDTYALYTKEHIKEYSHKMISFAGHDEKELLEKAWSILNKNVVLSGFNIVDFDMPLLARKYLYHNFLLPSTLNIRGKKPWDIKVFDRMKDLMFGSNKKTSLERVSVTLGLGTSKDGEIKGSNVGQSYWDGAKIESIQIYCEKDVKVDMDIVYKLIDLNLTKPS